VCVCVCVHTKFPRAQVLVRTYTGHSPHLDMEFPLHSSWPSPRQCDAVNLCLLHTCCQIGVSLQHTYGNFSLRVFLSQTEQNRAEQNRPKTLELQSHLPLQCQEQILSMIMYQPRQICYSVCLLWGNYVVRIWVIFNLLGRLLTGQVCGE